MLIFIPRLIIPADTSNPLFMCESIIRVQQPENEKQADSRSRSRLVLLMLGGLAWLVNEPDLMSTAVHSSLDTNQNGFKVV